MAPPDPGTHLAAAESSLLRACSGVANIRRGALPARYTSSLASRQPVTGWCKAAKARSLCLDSGRARESRPALGLADEQTAVSAAGTSESDRSLFRVLFPLFPYRRGPPKHTPVSPLSLNLCQSLFPEESDFRARRGTSVDVCLFGPHLLLQ